MSTFQEILTRPSSDTEKPKPLPVGTYLAMVKGQYEKVTAKTGTEGVKFTLQLLAADEDVDETALAECLKGKPLSSRELKNTFWVTEDSAWRLGKFLEDLGFEPGAASYEQMMAAAPGQQVKVHLKHRASDDGSSVFAEISSTAPVEG